MEVAQRQGAVNVQGNQQQISRENLSDGVMEQYVMAQRSRPLYLESFYSIDMM